MTLVSQRIDYPGVNTLISIDSMDSKDRSVLRRVFSDLGSIRRLHELWIIIIFVVDVDSHIA